MKSRRTHPRTVIWFALALLLSLFAGQQQSIADSMPKEEFEQRVRDYLLAHPEAVVEALQAYDARQKQAQEDAAKAALTARAEEIFRDPASPVGGNVEGSVTLVEFFDYNCPYCRQMMPVMEQAVAADPQLRIAYKEFPILGPDSVFAAKAALAANLQGGYAKFHKALFEVKSRITEAVVLKVAANVGLDVERLKTDMEGTAIRDTVDRNLQLAQDLGITGTPVFIAGDQILGGAVPLATLTQLIEQAK
ncbi:DsbA family protein [Mesorhizobium australicum]|uniref:Protein-disulfide isomerase n=1 Tax=Mesorhizobium australicum TaxID=536018 RepID=A0A1X7MQA2_9HYPH|nr:DsbA family protein [Mesorhizobium australicum]SMH26153.1 Protein-disulfide isomerase [Mesorhizobium australicum]